MSTAADIVRELDVSRLGELLSASPKTFREELFRAAGVKVKTDAFSLGKGSKSQVRTERFHGALQEGLELRPEVFEELIRNYLFTKRSLLADALDHFSVPHDNGLTDADLDFLGELDPAKVK